MNNKVWPQKQLGSVATLQRGFDLPKTQRREGACPVISSGGLSGYHNECKVKAPGVVTGRYGSVGEVFYVEQNFWPHNTTLWVKDFHGNDEKFIYYLLVFFNFKRFSDKTGVPGVNRNDLHKVKVVCPPLTQQKAISGLLSTWDSAIRKTERLIEEKEKRFTWLLKTLINDQCQRWKHLRSEKIFESVSEKNCPDEELLSVTQDRGVIPRHMLEGRVMSPDGSTESYKLIKRGDFVISLRSFQGGVEYSEYRGIVSPAYTVLRNKLPIHTDFYRHFFKSYIFIEKYLRIAVIGIRDGKQISMPDFKSVKLPYPPIDDQKKIATVLNAAQKEIGLLKRKLDLLKKQKRGLMQKLLTGRWRVKT
ncbi:MAG: restriction endonuclease subunit S [Nitrospirae bacterium]|nr:restriction endonuclease subunit S [Nitrospirota bacterium]